MRRKLLVASALLGILGLSAQAPNLGDKLNITAPSKQTVSEAINTKSAQSVETTQSRSENTVGTVIGHTTYDLQTNSANPDRIRLDENGNVQITWTGSTEKGDLSFPDRGSFYRYYDKATDTWTEEPTQRLEGNSRTGWPANDFLGNGGEIVIAHNPTAGDYNLVSMTRETKGEGAWTGPTALSNTGIWPRIATTGDKVFVIYSHTDGGEDADGFTMMAISSDNGATWDTTDMLLPGINAENGYTAMSSDAYAIDARDSIVVIVAGGSYNDVRVWKSTDYGVTWSSKVAMDVGLDNFAGREVTDITDIDGDGIGDTITAHDAAYELLIDADGIAHVWCGRYVFLDDDVTTYGVYFPYSVGLLYWNETMEEDGMEEIEPAFMRDMNGNNTLDIGVSLPGYGASLISMAAASHDVTDNSHYVVFSMPVENSDLEGDPEDSEAESYRDLYGMVGALVNVDTTKEVITITSNSSSVTDTIHIDSIGNMDVASADTVLIDTTSMDTNYVFTTTTVTYDTVISTESHTIKTYAWAEPANLTNTAMLQQENVYASAYDYVVDGKVHVWWQRDDEPGHAMESEPADAIRDNDILYHAFDIADFTPGAPTPAFSDTAISCSRAIFTNESSGEIWENTWDFGDGFGSTDIDAGHTYLDTVPTTYEVCLTVGNPWGEAELCKDVFMSCLNVEDIYANKAIAVYPNPSTGLLNIDINISNGQNLEVEVLDLLGNVVYNYAANNTSAQRFDIDLTNQSTGVYFVKVKINEEIFTSKVTLTK